jgi:hypothetical protein
MNQRNRDRSREPSLAGVGATTMPSRGIEEMDLVELRQFGAEMHRLEFPSIAVGGFVVSGRRAATQFAPEKEENIRGEQQQAGEEAGSAAGSRKRSPTQAAASRAQAHAVKHDSALAQLVEESTDYGAKPTVVRRFGRFAHLGLPVGLFRTLPFRAELLMEVPLVPRLELRKGLASSGGLVPDVRAWSRWSFGLSGTNGLIASHHGYPDRSMCVCMAEEWHLGRDPLITYVDFCILWIARVLHECLIGFYPGLQHYGEKVRVERDRPDEFCGCGKALPYAACHRAADFAMPLVERARRHYSAQRAYRDELIWQGRTDELPAFPT